MKPEHRSMGVGKAFFGQLGKIAQEKVSVRWRSISFTLVSEESQLQVTDIVYVKGLWKA